MLFLVALVIGIAFGLLVGGRVGNLARLRFRWPWLLLVAVLVREIIVLTPLNLVEGLQYLYLLGLIAIVVWTVYHWRRLRGIWLVTIGAALNVLVIAANGGRMPVAHEFARSLVRSGTLGQYTLMGSGTNLNFLGDWISLHPLSTVYSPGDVLIALGLAVTVFIATATPARIVS